MISHPINEKKIPLKFASAEVFNEKIVSPWSQSAEAQDESVVVRYYKGLQKAHQYLERHESETTAPLFEPMKQPPELSEEFVALYSPAKMQLAKIGEYKNRTLKLLNLMRDPATNVTKTNPSVVMIGRAVQHILDTGENIIITVTTSGNKGIALRAAAERAISLGLVEPSQLRVVMMIPENSSHKLRESLFTQDKELAALNPIIIYTGRDSVALKKIGREFQAAYHDQFFQKYNTRLWNSLHLDNYRVGDSTRAFIEYETLMRESAKETPSLRLHVQAVSSAYGLIGYHLGRSVLVEEGLTTWEENPAYFLVQHLATSDMVLYHYFGSFERKNLPNYLFDEESGWYTQNQHAHFPEKTLEMAEMLDTTFYTLKPPTSPIFSPIINKFGGGGIVVSLHECLERYPLVRRMLQQVDINISPDPRQVTEWSIIMALTGVLNAIDRNIIPEQAEITVHGTGYYAAGLEYQPLNTQLLPTLSDDNPVDKLKKIILES